MKSRGRRGFDRGRSTGMSKTCQADKKVYGKYGTLAKKYLEEHNVAKYWSIVDLPEYLHGVDAAADRMWTAMYEKLSKMKKDRKTGECMHDLRVQEEMYRAIEEEILHEIVYVD